MDEIFTEADRTRLHEICEVVWARDDLMPQEEFELALPDAAAVVFGTWRWGRDALRRAGPDLRALLEVGGGHSHQDVDYEWAMQRGVLIGSCAPSMGRQVSEMALALTLAASREVCIGDRGFREGNEVYLHGGCKDMFLLYGKTVGFVGCGSLARSLQQLLAPFAPRLLGYDPWLPDRLLERRGIVPTSLETMFDACDVIYVLAVPTPANRGMITRELLDRIKPGRIIAVISRAHLVDFDALTELVLAGRFRAVVDVFPQEPLPMDHPIRKAEHAVLSAHRAGAVPEGLKEIGELVVDDLEMILQDCPPQRMQYATPQLRRRLQSDSD
jgi:phosphoglycerate dehydrogenase-like enzyme